MIPHDKRLRRAAGNGGLIARGSKDPCIGLSAAIVGGKNIEPASAPNPPPLPQMPKFTLIPSGTVGSSVTEVSIGCSPEIRAQCVAAIDYRRKA